MFQLTNNSSRGVIDILKETFSRYGIPDVVMTDNGPHFNSKDFKTFSQKWSFEHNTSSPYYA